MANGSPFETYQPNAIPRSITRKLYVHYRISGYDAGRIDVFDFQLTADHERMILCETEVTINIPEMSASGLKSKALEVLEAQKSKVLAENHQRLQAVQDKIDNLLAIEYIPEAA